MALVGQVETGYLQDGEEQGYAQAFCQRGEGHDEHGGEQLPAGNLDQAGNVLQEGAFGGRSREARRESSAHGERIRCGGLACLKR